ncbi:hypothetical protein SDC9_168341 [bioreactor metagenome]|uniref:Uncharacterized protein n=1 Tax=bioreactor metagenome TaxID=1076179 RepID=A0A645G4S7_9ZZZZ
MAGRNSGKNRGLLKFYFQLFVGQLIQFTAGNGLLPLLHYADFAGNGLRRQNMVAGEH